MNTVSPPLHILQNNDMSQHNIDVENMASAPATPLSPSSPDPKPKKASPLNDLIETEKLYVDQMTGIIRKVAAAWSRSNLPPPELDIMFRSIEGVYKANRGLYSKLKDIGANPSSPKALGDLLMRWIDDLQGPYTTYCTKFLTGFDTWDPVQSNPRLSATLQTFSELSPPPSSSQPIWTLDTLFLLPKARLKYYKKLYNRLLKSTVPGRSDHKLLIGALENLDKLLETLDSRASSKVGSSSAPTPVDNPVPELEDEVVIDMRAESNNASIKIVPSSQPSPKPELAHGSENSSVRGSSFSDGQRLSGETNTTSVNRGSTSTLSMPISDLERRLSTQKTLDIFTMKPKVVKLQMTPPTLTFTREMCLSIDVAIRFTPRATGEEIVHRRGHVFILSDLFLVCERISAEEQAQHSTDGADMWLCYPPLAGKVLRVSDVEGQDNSVQVAIMRKEFLYLEAESSDMRNKLFAQLKGCIEFSSSLPPPAKQPPPPVPSLDNIPRSMGNGPIGNNTSNIGPNKGNMRHSDQRTEPPATGPQTEMNGNQAYQPQFPQYQGPNAPGGSIRGLPAQPSPHYPDGPLRTSASLQQFPDPNSSFGPGIVIPPARSASFMTGPPGNPAMVGQNPDPTYARGPQGAPYPRPGGQPPFPQFPVNGRLGMPHGLPPGALPPRPPSEPTYSSGVAGAPRSMNPQYSQYDPHAPPPPVPPFSGSNIPRNNSLGAIHAPQPRPVLPSAQFNTRSVSLVESFDAPSPPGSPIEETQQQAGPVTSSITAQMKCKVFLQQQHAQWKSLGSAKLKLYHQDPTNIKQLVVEADNKDKTVLISTIVLTDGVERVGKTGIAIELSDQGTRTGVVYMIQLRNETSAGGLFTSLLAGSDRSK